jgi:hypothetical protein
MKSRSKTFLTTLGNIEKGPKKGSNRRQFNLSPEIVSDVFPWVLVGNKGPTLSLENGFGRI